MRNPRARGTVTKRHPSCRHPFVVAVVTAATAPHGRVSVIDRFARRCRRRATIGVGCFLAGRRGSSGLGRRGPSGGLPPPLLARDATPRVAAAAASCVFTGVPSAPAADAPPPSPRKSEIAARGAESRRADAETHRPTPPRARIVPLGGATRVGPYRYPRGGRGATVSPSRGPARRFGTDSSTALGTAFHRLTSAG